MRGFIFILAIGLISCQEERQSLDGHWVSKEFFEGKPFFTLDIYEKDSFLIINKNSFASFYSNYSVMKEGYSRWGMDCAGFALILDGDSLHSYDEPYPFNLDSCLHKSGSRYNSILVRADSKSTLFKSLFLRIALKAELPDEVNGLIRATSKTRFIDLTFGEPVFSDSKKDTVMLQAEDVYLGAKDIPIYISRHAAEYYEQQQADLVIRLNADKDIPDDYLKSFFPKNDTLPLWRTYLNRDKTELLYKPL